MSEMKKVHMVYGKGCDDIQTQVEKSDFKDLCTAVTIDTFLEDETLTVSDHVIIVGSSDEIKSVFAKAQKDDFSVSILPLKNQVTLRSTFELPLDVAEALKISFEGETKEIDVLYADDKLILWGALVGDAPPLTYRSSSYRESNFSERIALLKDAFSKLKSLQKKNLKLTTAKAQEINTAASGLVIIEHDNHTCAANLVHESLSLSDGKLSALLVSPTSIIDYLHYLYVSVIKGRSLKKGVLPNSVAFIKSESLQVESKEPMDVVLDGEPSGQTPVTFSVRKAALRFRGSVAFWEKSKEGVSDKETVKLSGLVNNAEESQKQTKSKLPFFTHASEEQYRELFAGLREEGRPSQAFVVLMILSTILATVGLFLNSASVVIGAMLLAPLMQPIVSSAMGVLRGDQSLLFGSLKTVGIGVALVLGSAALIAMLLPFETMTGEISARLRPSLLDLIVALVSGLAAAYAKNNEKIMGSLAGVAIAVALVPPLSTAGIGIGWMSWQVFSQAFLLFVTNFVGIILAASFLFMVLGYSPVTRAKKGLMWAFVMAFIIAIPLFFSFRTMVLDAHIHTTLEKTYYELSDEAIDIENVSIEHREVPVIRCDLIVKQTLNTQELIWLKQKIEKDLDQEIVLEAVQRVRF